MAYFRRKEASSGLWYTRFVTEDVQLHHGAHRQPVVAWLGNQQIGHLQSAECFVVVLALEGMRCQEEAAHPVLRQLQDRRVVLIRYQVLQRLHRIADMSKVVQRHAESCTSEYDKHKHKQAGALSTVSLQTFTFTCQAAQLQGVIRSDSHSAICASCFWPLQRTMALVTPWALRITVAEQRQPPE